jgi:hypothetical protein
MSIIYDALKKVQKTTKDQKPPEVSRRPRQKTGFSQYLIYALIICVGAFAGKVFFEFISPAKTSQPVEKNQPKPLPVVIEPPKEEIKQPRQAEPVQPKVEFILNGVFFSQGQGYALINNQISKVGDMVDGAFVSNITIEGVQLTRQDETISLSTRTR